MIFNQYTNPIALGHIVWRYYIVYCCWIAFEVVFLYFYIVETKNLTLEETAALFDGKDAFKEIAGSGLDSTKVPDEDPQRGEAPQVEDKLESEYKSRV